MKGVLLIKARIILILDEIFFASFYFMVYVYSGVFN